MNKKDNSTELGNLKSTALQKVEQLCLTSEKTPGRLSDDCWFAYLSDLITLLLENSNKAAVYDMIRRLAIKLDPDILLGELMDKIICFKWPSDMNLDEYSKAVDLFMVYVELFGNSLEQLTRPKEWMLYLPFFTNYLKKALDVVEFILVKDDFVSSNSKGYLNWSQVAFWIASAVLDFTHFIHTATVNQDTAEFPVDSADIGSESGDTKRRYLGYFLQNLVLEKVVLNFDMQLSALYFENQHPKYNIVKTKKLSENAIQKEIAFKLADRCIELSEMYGFTYDRIFQLLNCLNQNQNQNALSEEEEVYENEKQMINQRLYPLSYDGVACLMALCFYKNKNSQSDMTNLVKAYIGLAMSLLIGSPEMCSHIDKGIFILLLFSDNITATITMKDVEKKINGPLGYEASFQVSRIIQIISAVASMCPDSSIRFFSYQLIQKFLNFGDEETRLFFLVELLDRCPFSSMKTAAISLLKDQIDQSFNNEEASIFKTPIIVHTFFPIVFQFKSVWHEKPSEFYDDYNTIAQSLNFYYYLLLKDQHHNWTTIWSVESRKGIETDYLEPIQKIVMKNPVILSDNEAFHINQQELLKSSLSTIFSKLDGPQ